MRIAFVLIVLTILLTPSANPQATSRMVYVDQVNGAGIGLPQVPWGAGITYPVCRAVSFNGNFLAVQSCQGVQPGTNPGCWFPVPNPATPLQLDCGFYMAASEVGPGVGATLVMGSGTYLSNLGLVEPTVAQAGWPVVNLYGQGRSQTSIKLNNNNGDNLPFLLQPKSLNPYAFASFTWQGFTVDANWNAPAAVGVYGAQQYVLRDMILADAIDGSDHEIEFGDQADTQHGWTYEPVIENVDLGTFKGFGTGAVIDTKVTNGVPAFTVIQGGQGYVALDTKAVLANPGCKVPGITSVALTNGSVSGVSSTATGCPANLFTILYGGPNITYGYKFSNTSDSKSILALTNGGVGWIAGMYLSNVTSQMEITKYHAESVMIGAQDYGGAAFYSPQFDTVFQYGFDIEGGGVTDIFAPVFEWNNPNMTGSRDYYFGEANGLPGWTAPQAINIYGERCGNAAVQPGYAHFDSSAGVIDPMLNQVSAAMPSFVHLHDPLPCNHIGLNTVVNSPAAVLPAIVGTILPALYSGNAPLTLPLATPPFAGSFRVCAYMDVKTAAGGGTIAAYALYVADGHSFQSAITSRIAATAWDHTQSCFEFYQDAQQPISFLLDTGSETGTPATVRYWATLEQIE